MKSRLAVKDFSDEYKRIIDAYFDEIFETAKKERIKASIPEYEKFYDAEVEEFSFAGAEEIERSSWSTTARLIVEDVDEGENEIENIQSDENKTEILSNEPTEEVENYGLSDKEIEFVYAIKCGDITKIASLATVIAMPADAIADKINEAFADGFGDVIIEGSHPDFTIIEDYEQEVEEWLRKLMK